MQRIAGARFWRRAGVGLAVGAALSGCVASGPIGARVAGPDGGATVAMRYRSERFNQNGTMTATMPGGEVFTGRYLEVTSDTDAVTLDPYWGAWGVGWGGWGGWGDDYGPYIGGAGVPTFIKNYSGKVIAVLLGDRGGRMRCRFHLAEPEEGMSGGGVGECQTDAGAKIDVTF